MLDWWHRSSQQRPIAAERSSDEPLW